jgi:hypothetical protein
VFCGDSDTLTKNSDISKTLINASLVPTLNGGFIIVPTSNISGSPVVLNFNLDLVVPLDIYTPNCTIIVYGVDSGNNKTFVDIFSNPLNKITSNSPGSTTINVNNANLETQINNGISLSGYRFMNYTIVGGGGRGGNGVFNNQEIDGIPINYWGGGGGGSGYLKSGNIDLYNYQSSIVKSTLGAGATLSNTSGGGTTTLYIDSNLYDSALGGQNGYDGGPDNNGGDGGNGGNGGGAAGRITSIDISSGSVTFTGSGGLGDISNGGENGGTATLENTGIGGGTNAMQEIPLNTTILDDICSAGGGGGGGLTTQLATGGIAGGSYEDGYFNPSPGIDYTGGGGGGGTFCAEGYPPPVPVNGGPDPPGAGGKGYTSLTLTSYQYQYVSNFKHDPSKFESYTVDIKFN